MTARRRSVPVQVATMGDYDSRRSVVGALTAFTPHRRIVQQYHG